MCVCVSERETERDRVEETKCDRETDMQVRQGQNLINGEEFTVVEDAAVTHKVCFVKGECFPPQDMGWKWVFSLCFLASPT